MAIYSCWIFNRHCNCVYSREWEPKIPTAGSRLFSPFTNNSSTSTSTNSTTTSSSTVNQTASTSKNELGNGLTNVSNQNDKAKLLFGAIFSLRNIASKLYSPKNNHDPNDESINPNSISNYLTTFSTNNYRVHYFESASNWKIALISDPKCQDLQSALNFIYVQLFNDFVVKNALSQIDFDEGEYIDNPAFINGLDNYVTSLPAFTS
ncbi:TRAPP subunit [Saccharomycopsis crataegensis]|uniref:Trafficking protein particle complex subunit n=1 Tax=Saccharomycopsis crataegensis TaxID=43959 RepID=A0AAV5QMU3_9ASCO|nr:TRAPP subunit [Saccharomycopsis crataegensis]